MKVKHEWLEVSDVEFDSDNPRITEMLATYTDPNPDDVAMALQPGDAKYNELRQAIRTHEGLINPIIVNKLSGKHIAIEGNTRLAIFKQFNKEQPEDERWQQIPAYVYDEMTKHTIDAVRLQAHLVGVRNWSAYAKAKYLHTLHESENLPLNSLVDFCGGNKLDVIRNIQAFKEMEYTYRPLLPDDYFDQHKFSNFFEAQKPTISRAIVKAGFNYKNFAEWVRDDKFQPRQELVRMLPKILANPRARQVFLEEGADKAQNYIDRPELSKELQNAKLVELCEAVKEKIRELKITERDDIKDNDESVQCLDDTLASLKNFFDNEIREQ